MRDVTVRIVNRRWAKDHGAEARAGALPALSPLGGDLLEVIVVEDLEVRQMVRAPRPRPDPEREGTFLPTGRPAKAGLDRAILAPGPGTPPPPSRGQGKDKATASGVVVARVDPACTSQTCAYCGHVAKESRKSQAAFSCVACGHEHHADVHAAASILARGISSLAPTPGHGAGPGDRAARRGPASACQREPPCWRGRVGDSGRGSSALQGREDVKDSSRRNLRRPRCIPEPMCVMDILPPRPEACREPVPCRPSAPGALGRHGTSRRRLT